MAAVLATLAVVAGVTLLVAAFLVATFLKLWLNAKAAGVALSIPHMAMMRLRRLDPEVADGGDHDIGYPRAVLNSQGQVVTAYYYNTDAQSERFIGVSLWDAEREA